MDEDEAYAEYLRFQMRPRKRTFVNLVGVPTVAGPVPTPLDYEAGAPEEEDGEEAS